MPAYYNGKAYEDINEYYYAVRHRREITTDKELIAYAREVTSNWYYCGWHRTFLTYYFGRLENGRYEMTKREYERLLELQKMAVKAFEGMQAAREWKLSKTYYYADNSVEEVWEDKFGNTKTHMKVYPHGDVC